jgi:hypothetical protein
MDKPEEAKRNITRLADRKIWDRLMADTGMYTFMSSCQRDEWNSQLMSDTCPEITLDNVLATFRHLNASKMQTFEQGLIDVYRKRAARTVLTGMCYSVGSAARQGSSSPTRFIGQSAMTSRT